MLDQEFLLSWFSQYISAENSGTEEKRSPESWNTTLKSTVDMSLPHLPNDSDTAFEIEEAITREELEEKILSPLFLQEFLCLIDPDEFDVDEFPNHWSQISHLLSQILTFFYDRKYNAANYLKLLKENYEFEDYNCEKQRTKMSS